MAVSTKNIGSLASVSGVTSITPTLPTVDAGDLLIATVLTVAYGGGSITPPAGWTQISQDDTSYVTICAGIFYKIAAGGDADPTFDFATSGDAQARVVSFSGANATTPIGTIGTIAIGGESPHESIGITPVGNDLVFYWDASYGDVAALDTPSGWAEFYDSGAGAFYSAGGTKAAVSGVSSGGISAATAGGSQVYFQQQVELISDSPTSGYLSSDGSSASSFVGDLSAEGTISVAGVAEASFLGGSLASGSLASSGEGFAAFTGGLGDVDPDLSIVHPPSQDLVFSNAAQLVLAGQRVGVTLGVKMELASETLHLWLGNGRIRSNDGQYWEGLGRLGSVSGLEFGALAATQPINLTLSGLDATLAEAARSQYSEMRGRRVSIYVMVFDQNMQPVDLPYLCMLATIDAPRLRRSGDMFVLEVTAEPIFNTKHMPALNLVTDADQQTRHPGDKIFERAAYSHTLYWNQ